MTSRVLTTTASALALTLGLSACGGGGGGSGARPQPSKPAPISPTPTPTPTPTPVPTPTSTINYNTAEYQSSNYAVTANAISAYQQGGTGQGVKIAVIDSGINPNLPEFTGKIDPASRDVAGNRGVSDVDGHGTAVSAVAAAARNGSNTHGVAFDATIISLRADTVGSCADTSEDGGCTFYDSNIATGIDAARVAGARVINMSLGGGTPDSGLLAAMQRAVSAGIVLVISAGNDGEKPQGVNPDPFALTPAQHFGTNVIIAGSVGVGTSSGTDTNQLSTFSNKAGTGAAYYLAALGYRDRAPDHTGTQYLWSGTSFSAPTISGAAALLADAFPNLTGAQIVQILLNSADDLGAAGTDAIFGRGRLDIAAAFQPIGTTTLAGTQEAMSLASNGDLPAAAGDGGTQGSAGAIILDGYSRAFAIDIAKTLQKAEQSKPLARALQGNVRVGGASVGPVSIAMTVSERRDLSQGYALAQLGIGPEDARKSRLIAGSAVARLDRKTAAALGFAEGAKAMERRLSGAHSGAFLIAKDISAEPGFAAKRNGSVAVRRNLGPVGMTISGETGSVWQEVETSATGSPYRWASLSVDRNFGKTWLSASLSNLDEKRTFLGGRMSDALGGGGANSNFLDLEARRELGAGWSASLTGRRGWTSFGGGKFQTAAYGFDLAKLGVLGSGDRLGLRVSQPLRIESGGFAMMLPTGYDYATRSVTNSLTHLSLSPRGRELDTELSYGSTLFGDAGWIGGNLFMRREPGHIGDADDDYGAAIRFTLGF